MGEKRKTTTTTMTCAADAHIGFVHSRNGICCGWGGAERLLALLGRARALEILSSGRLVGAREAHSLRLAYLLDDEQADDELQRVHQFMADHAIASRRTAAAIKATLGRPPDPSRRELHCFGATWGHRAHMRALEANLKHAAGPK